MDDADSQQQRRNNRMSIARIRHAHLWDNFFGDGRIVSPVLTLGVDDIRLPAYATASSPIAVLRRVINSGRLAKVPNRYRHSVVHEMFAADPGCVAESLDLFDDRADWRWDMNVPVEPDRHGRYGTVVDIGSSEHVFDTRTCLENIIALVRVGGWYLGHLPVNGYFAHGLHTFNPMAVVDALELNGFEVTTVRFTDAKGRSARNPARTRDCLMWLAAHKVTYVETFTVPQQSYWKDFYEGSNRASAVRVQKNYWEQVGRIERRGEEVDANL